MQDTQHDDLFVGERIDNAVRVARHYALARARDIARVAKEGKRKEAAGRLKKRPNDALGSVRAPLRMISVDGAQVRPRGFGEKQTHEGLVGVGAREVEAGRK